MMSDRLTFWLGAEAEAEWYKFLDKSEAEAEALRHREEATDVE